MVGFMNTFISIIVFSSMFSYSAGLNVNCPTTQCSHGGPEIRFPFRAKDHQLQHCGCPGFELVCKGNETILEFPYFGELNVKSIDYDVRRLNLLDTKNCVSDVFLNLNFSATPFHYYFVVRNYTYLNCSNKISHFSFPVPHMFLQQVPCQSGSEYHVYIVESSLTVDALPNSCQAWKTVAIPFPYSPYLYGDSFGLAVTWDVFEHGSSETGGCCGFKTESNHEARCFNSSDHKGFSRGQLITVVGIIILFVMVATWTSTKIYCLWNSKNGQENQSKVEKTQEDLRSFNLTKGSHAYTEGMTNDV